MQYIQCPHCLRRYSTTQKLLDSAGKRIRCKHCTEIFVIEIKEDRQPQKEKPAMPVQPSEPVTPQTDKAEPAEHLAPPRQQADKRQSEEKPLKAKQKPSAPSAEILPSSRNAIMIAATTLGMMLVVATGYLYKSNPELFGFSAPSVAHASIGIDQSDPFANLARPIKPFSSIVESIDPDVMTRIRKNSDSHTARENSLAPDKQSPTEPGAAQAGSEKLTNVADYSPPCREAAAELWISRFQLTHTRLAPGQYMQLFNKGSNQIKAVRTQCGSDAIAEITDSAVQKVMLTWAQAEINNMGGERIINAAEALEPRQQ